ncbi:MAG: VWA domain-containing protein [bacterium]|nr:VWA domain-containing protein [bacterium]
MEKVINIIVDASGSMAEDDKNAVVKYMLNGICNASRTDYFANIGFDLFQWGKVTKRIENMEKAKIEFSGKSNVNGLEILNDLLGDQESIVLISDGNMEPAEKQKLKSMGKRIIPIYVGIDANRSVLQEVSTNKVVYSVMDFMQALSDALI